jgi:ABC-type branched-subunit amino acid transport system substrate-binding protein
VCDEEALAVGPAVQLRWCVLFGTALSARAQNPPGVTDTTITIGSCSALEGPQRSLGVETVAGATAYFTLTNDEGGVHGRKLRLNCLRRKLRPGQTQACFDRLLNDKVFAMGFFVGTPTAVKYVPLAESNKIPLIGLFTGAQTLYTPMRHWIVNVRASYYDETREQMDGVWEKLAYHKVGVIYPEDAFGSALKTVALYRRSLSKYAPSAKPNFVSLEGFVDAMLMVEGIKRAAKDLTREGLIRGIESIHEEDLGLGPQLKLSYSAKHHKGFDHVIPTVVRGGRAVPFTDWSVGLK